jgi:hypothetical protein
VSLANGCLCACFGALERVRLVPLAPLTDPLPVPQAVASVLGVRRARPPVEAVR